MSAVLPEARAALARPAPVLRVQRVLPGGWPALKGLGGLGWGCGGAALCSPEVSLLGDTAPWVDAWLGGSSALRSGHSGCVHWQSDGDWSFGLLQLPEADGGLEARAYRAYRDLFAALQDCGTPQLLRLWNYLPRINADGGGLERYRQFNMGRQRAFLDAGRDAFANSPAACALGSTREAGGLRVAFLAGRRAPRPVDNPRQVPAWRYSRHYGPRAPTFSRAALAEVGGNQLALLVSGTASILGEHTVHLGDVRAQTEETLRNLQAVIDSAHREGTARFALADLQPTVYIRHAADLAAVRALLAAQLPAWAQAPCVQADICRAELLVEIEAHGLAPGALV